jgi:glycosyltransferase involved in cell wall biosynthesis
MNQVRLHGDPFGEDAAASLLRSFLRQALGSRLRTALSLAAVRPRAALPGERAVPLTDGVRDLEVGTRLPPAEVELLLRAANELVAATAPVVVFAPAERRADAAREAALTWPGAAAVLVARDGASAVDLLERLRAELRWAGTESPPHALDERVLAPWLALPVVAGTGPVVCVDGGDVADGTDLAVAAWRRELAPHGRRLRVVVTAGGEQPLRALGDALGADAALAEVVQGAFEPAHVRDAAAIVLPWRALRCSRTLVLALASGRPVCAARFAATAPLLAAPGCCWPIGGDHAEAADGRAAHFAPRSDAVAAALRQAVADPAAAAGIGARAREWVVGSLTRERPAPPPAPVATVSGSRRPVVVLESPLFETSSTAELTLATARALHARGRVDVRLVPVAPLRHGLPWLRARAPELEPLLCRDVRDADLWLASGWPVRAHRPPCRTWALRVDQEYGALPLELTPHVTADADVVVVHSEHVLATVAGAGRDPAGLQLIPHGVDAAMRDDGPADAAISAWKGERPAVLFCGGLIWRKGFDVFLRAVLAARVAGADFTVVVKSTGHDQHYGRFHLGELLQRYRATPGTPPLHVVDGELDREQLAAVYRACDVLLHPYRGEGFCLPVLEARACGLPVLATAGGATEALLAGPAASRIPSARRAVDLPGAHAAPPWVLEPDAGAAGQLLVRALADLPALRADARAFAPAVRAAYSWDAAAASLEQLAFAAAGRDAAALRAGEPTVALPLPERMPVTNEREPEPIAR